MTRTEALQTVLEFVERYNKQDAEKEVAKAVGVLEAMKERQYDSGPAVGSLGVGGDTAFGASKGR